MIMSFLVTIIGFIFLIKGSDFLVDGSSGIAKKFHIPEIIIGLTIVSIGTSMPELFVSTVSSINGYSDMSIGNAIGSNLSNLLLILGLSATTRPIKFQRETKLIEIPMCLIITIIFMIFCNTSGLIQRSEAVILLILFVMFIVYTIIMGKKGEEFDGAKEITEINVEDKPQSIVKSIIFIILGIIGLKIGGDLTIDNSLIIANQLNISEKIISLTILSIGTSLPELVTSVTAAFKGNSDIAIGNIIGSNIFNILLIIGVSAVISPLVYNFTYNIQMSFLILAILLLVLFSIIPPKDKMTRLNGCIYLFIYAIYMIISFQTI